MASGKKKKRGKKEEKNGQATEFKLRTTLLFI